MPIIYRPRIKRDTDDKTKLLENVNGQVITNKTTSNKSSFWCCCSAPDEEPVELKPMQQQKMK